MPSAQSHTEGESLPPVHPEAPAEAYSPEQARRHREYSVWDPRAAPGTYLLLTINIAVYLWMVTHHVDWNKPT
jgi:rhomboid protease GluP